MLMMVVQLMYYGTTLSSSRLSTTIVVVAVAVVVVAVAVSVVVTIAVVVVAVAVSVVVVAIISSSIVDHSGTSMWTALSEVPSGRGNVKQCY